jgi:hypothetical protein
MNADDGASKGAKARDLAHNLKRAAGSPEKQGISDYENENNATGAPDQHVTNIVPGHPLSRFGRGFDDLIAMPFRHRTPPS